MAVWVGTVDDLWSFGRPIGEGGPWKNARVSAGQSSEPYLMTGYEKKAVTLSHTGAQPVRMRVEVDLSGTDTWVEYASFDVPAGKPLEHVFPDEFQAYWVRVKSDAATTVNESNLISPACASLTG